MAVCFIHILFLSVCVSVCVSLWAGFDGLLIDCALGHGWYGIRRCSSVVGVSVIPSDCPLERIMALGAGQWGAEGEGRGLAVRPAVAGHGIGLL